MKFYNMYKVITILAIVVALAGCTKRFNDLNTPPDRISADKIDVALLGQAFAQAQYQGMFQDRDGFQILQSLYTDQYAQYFAATHPNFPSDQFQEVGSWTGRYGWDYIYTVPAPQVHFVEQFTEKNEMPLANAIAKVWRVEFFHRITDIWGPIIYSQFGNGQTVVTYDAQKDIYHNFFQALDSAVAVLKEHAGENAFGSNDLVFGGDANKWLVFANSLRLRLAMRISYVEPGLAKQEAEKAVAAGVMTSNTDNAYVATTLNSLNGYAKITYIHEFRMSATMASVLLGFEDPRLSEYFAEAEVGGGYKGIRNGLTVAERGDRITLQNTHSFIAQKWRPLANGGTNPPIDVMAAAEVYFLRAEGALKGWNMGGTAQELYNEGIRTSLKERTGASPTAIENYITSTKTPTALNDQWNTPAMSDIPVAFLTSGTPEKQLEQVITQKWIALYPNSSEAWAERRRTGYPVGFPIIQSLNLNVAANQQMRRLTFAQGEFTTNADGVKTGISLLGGENNNATKLWWDAK